MQYALFGNKFLIWLATEIIGMLFHIAARLAFCPALPAKAACVAPPCFSKETNYTKSRTSSGNIELKATAGSMSSSSKILFKMWLQSKREHFTAWMLACNTRSHQGRRCQKVSTTEVQIHGDLGHRSTPKLLPPTLSTQNAKNAAARRPRCCGFAIEGRDLRRKPAVPWPLTICHCQRTRCPGPPPIGNDIRKQYYSCDFDLLSCVQAFIAWLFVPFWYRIPFGAIVRVERSNDQRVFCKNATPHLVHFALA